MPLQFNFCFSPKKVGKQPLAVYFPHPKIDFQCVGVVHKAATYQLITITRA
jgi:hypothetical protein